MKQASARRLYALAVAGFLLALPLAAQTTLADPNDPLYADIDAWATKGLLKNLPRLRPYTMTMTLGLLKEVVATGETADIEEAQRYIDILGDHAVHPRADVRADAVLSSSSGTSKAVLAAPGASVNTIVGDNLGISARMDVWLAKGENVTTLNPYGMYYDRDLLYGSGSGLGSSTEVLQDLVSDLSYGNADLGIQAGYMRGSWGPIFDDGIVIGPQSPESGQLTFSWRSPSLTMDFGFFMLEQGFAASTGVLDRQGNPVGFNSGKYLMIHGLNWAPNGWLELGAFESIVWTDRIEPLYFIPLSEYFISHSFSNYTDKAHAGLSASVYLPDSMKFDLVGYVDDINFSGILGGTWDTKWKLAAQASLSWAPQSPIVQRVSLDYTAVLPYMYTYEYGQAGSDSSGNPYYGANAYTNAGQNIGPDLDPNSDRITLQAKSRTVDGAQISGILRLIRHGNDSAGVNGYDASTSASGDASGDLGDPGVINLGNGTTAWVFQGNYPTGTWPMYLRFLTQSVLQITAQAGLSVDYTKRIENIGTLNASFGYTFEYIANDGCIAGQTSVNNYFSFEVGFAF
jgi:hypothetical protein